MVMTQFGVYVSSDPSTFVNYDRWAGSPPDNALNYLNNNSWSEFDSSAPWAVGLWQNIPTIWSVPLTVTGTSLEQVATGDYNSHFVSAAKQLAKSTPSKDGNIYVRVGWEFNGSWMPWSAQGHEAAFIKSFQNLVDSFRSISDKFKFVWDVNQGASTIDPAKAYPGDKYVDVVGMDTYYNTAYNSADPVKAFKDKVSEPYGLQWQQDFAAAHGKPTAISEWGVQTDNAAPYIQAMAKWLSDHNMVYANYWQANAGGFNGKLDNGQYPAVGAAYKSAFVNPSQQSTVPTTDKLVVTVSGDSWQGNPHFIVTVDGQQIGDTLTTAASHSAGQTEDITLTGNFGLGVHKVAVQFLDDAYGGKPGTDRNLYVHQISLNGQTYTGDKVTDGALFKNTTVATLLGNYSANFFVFQKSSPADSSGPVASQALTANHDADDYYAVYRFFDTKTGDHFYTTSTAEKTSVIATNPTYQYEGTPWATPKDGPGTIDVFRFYDTVHGTHFLTSSASERDTILKTMPTYAYEGVAFEAYADAGTPGGLTLDRFYNTQTGNHHYSASAAETLGINSGAAGPNWVYEGPGFTVHAPTLDMLYA
jgi:hypothetical protein